MQIIKVQYIKNQTPAGRAYTFFSEVDMAVGDTVLISENVKGVVTEVDVPESEIESFKDKVKTIKGRYVEQKLMSELKNWSVFAVNRNDFQAPELGIPHLQGEIYNDARFVDSEFVHTSRIVKIEDCVDFKKAITRSGTEYVLRKETVSEECEKQFPDYYERLILKDEVN